MAKLSLNGAEALAEIKKLIAEINALKQSSKKMSTATKDNFDAIEVSITNLRNKIGLLTNKLNYLQAILKKNSEATNKDTNSTNKNSNAKNKNAKASNTAAKGNKNLLISFKNLIAAGVLLKANQLMQQLFTNVYENIKTFDSLAFTLEKITKTTLDYENSQRFLLRITEAYGVELVSTTTRWTRFLAAATESGLALREAENIFESMTKASAALGLKTEELSSVYLALEQMLSKGKVSTEELRRQLGERLPGAMGIMAASMGKTIPELDKMLKLGQVLSADVLPNFAKAVERAYGIENADRIETLISKQNRLGAAWQTFIKNISEGDSVIKKVFGGLLGFLTETVNAWDKILRSTNQQLRIDVMIREEEFKKQLEASSKQFIEFTKNINEQDVKLNFDEALIKEQLKTAFGKEREDLLAQLDEIVRIRIVKDEEALENSKKIAKERISLAYSEYKEAKKIWEDIDKEFESVKSGESIKSQYNQADRDKAYSDLVQLEAIYNTFRKLVEESDVKIIKEDEFEIGKHRLREIKDYSLQIINEIAGYVSDANLDLFGDETLNLKDRLNALKTSVQQQVLIQRNLLEIEKRTTEDKYSNEIATARKAMNEGKLTSAEFIEFVKALEKEKNQYLVLQAQETGDKIAAINIKAAEQIKDLSSETFNQQSIDITENQFNKRIIAAKKEYEESKKTAEDKIKLEKELAKASIDSTNAIIDVKIGLIEQEIEILERSGNANSEYIAKLKREIDSLKSSKQIDPPIDSNKWQEEFEKAMSYAVDFNNAIGDIVDGLFARKIENIEAEIRAEENKYDRLIALAEDDEEQQATLQRNKEERIRKLEAKRLKEVQKQAKANKAFAIADIAINTAVAISKTLAQGGAIFGIPLVPIIAALGALQVAAVLAQPIPKYKDGVKDLPKDQIAMINDGSYKEYVERNGRILSTDKKDAVVELKKGDTVYKNYDEMANKSNLFKIKNNLAIAKYNNDKLLKDVTTAVTTGFKKAKISNTINLKNKSDNSSYARQMSRWN